MSDYINGRITPDHHLPDFDADRLERIKDRHQRGKAITPSQFEWLLAEVERRVTPEAIREAISEAHTHGWRSPHGLVGLFDVTPESAEPVPVDHERLISADLLAARLLEEE